MLDRGFIAGLTALSIWAVASARPLVAVVALLGLMASLSAALFRRFGSAGIGYRRRLGSSRAQFGDLVPLDVEFENLKLLPVAALAIEDQLPRFLPVEGGTVRPGHQDVPQLCITRAMLPYERVVRRLTVRCARRGRHQFGPARWESTDHLGTRSLHRTGRETDYLVVLPKVFPLAPAGSVARHLLGGRTISQSAAPDPLQRIGARAYAAGDPLRMVDWRASARRAALMVRVLAPSATPALELALDLQVREALGDRVEPDELEFAFSVVASLAAHAAARGWRFGLLANGMTDDELPLRLPTNSGPSQLTTLLDLLARARSVPRQPIATLLSAAPMRSDATLVVVTSGLDDRLRALLDQQRRRRDVTVLLTGPAGTAEARTQLPTLRVRYEEGWVHRDALALVG